MSRNRAILLAIAMALVVGGLIWAGSRTASEKPTFQPMADPRFRVVSRMNVGNPANPQHLRNPFPRRNPFGDVSLYASAPRTPQKLDSPPDTVQTQIDLLKQGSYQAFRSTFLPDVQSKLSTQAIQICRKRVAELPVKPDWEMARTGTDSEGRPTKWVSMFGKSETGFHEVGGRWLADSVWCNPPGFP